MTIETDLYDTLSNDAGVTALVSTRIYPQIAPESASLPYITYEVVSGERFSTIPGVGDAKRKRIQINNHDNTAAAARALAVAVEAALEGDGYLDLEYELYDPATQIHTSIVDWAFIS